MNLHTCSSVAVACVAVGSLALLSARPTIAASPAATSPAHPPLADGEPWIAYQAMTPDRGHGVHLIRPDGTGAHFPFAKVPGGQQLHPDWSPDGTQLVFSVDNLDGTQGLWIADTADWSTEEVVPCVTPCLWADEPAWSPDGTSIVFQRHTQTDAGEVSTVEVVRPDTGEIETVDTSGPEAQIYAPRWSPDGASVVVELPEFTANGVVGDSLGILDLSAATPSISTVVPPDRMANNPDWSPDGSLIVFSAPIAGGEPGGSLSDLWIVNADGTGLRQLTDVAASGGSAVQPTFTPDGARVIFKLDRVDGFSDAMATIAIDGSDLRSATATGPVYGWHARVRPTPEVDSSP